MLSQRFASRTAQLLRSRSATRRAYSDGGKSPYTGVRDNAFNNERWAVKKHAAGTVDLWRKLTLYVAFPCIIVGAANAYKLWKEHWEHWETLPPLHERPQYSYMNIRTKKFPWGDGDKTLFWNDKVNYHKKDDE